MRDKREFDGALREMDGHPPSAYERLAGDIDFTRYVLHSLRIVSTMAAGRRKPSSSSMSPRLSRDFRRTCSRRRSAGTALEDFLTRRLAAAIDRRWRAARAAGRDGCSRRPARPHDPPALRRDRGARLRRGPRERPVAAPRRADRRRWRRRAVFRGPAGRRQRLAHLLLPGRSSTCVPSCRRWRMPTPCGRPWPQRSLVRLCRGRPRSEVADDMAIEVETPERRAAGAGSAFPTGDAAVGDRHSGSRRNCFAPFPWGSITMFRRGTGRLVTVSDAVEIVGRTGAAGPARGSDARSAERRGRPALLSHRPPRMRSSSQMASVRRGPPGRLPDAASSTKRARRPIFSLPTRGWRRCRSPRRAVTPHSPSGSRGLRR